MEKVEISSIYNQEKKKGRVFNSLDFERGQTWKEPTHSLPSKCELLKIEQTYYFSIAYYMEY